MINFIYNCHTYMSADEQISNQISKNPLLTMDFKSCLSNVYILKLLNTEKTVMLKLRAKYWCGRKGGMLIKIHMYMDSEGIEPVIPVRKSRALPLSYQGRYPWSIYPQLKHWYIVSRMDQPIVTKIVIFFRQSGDIWIWRWQWCPCICFRLFG